jgi:hypothetical protein
VVVESVIQQHDGLIWWVIAVAEVCMANDLTIFSSIVHTSSKLASLCLDIGELTGERSQIPLSHVLYVLTAMDGST